MKMLRLYADEIGESRDLAPGDAMLVEDTTGKGHSSLVTSSTPFDGLMVRLE